jgi:glycosyltransferase involved in cell wall biosynthesis
MTAAVQRLTTGQPFDVIHFDAIHVMQYGPAVQRPPRAIVYNWHNIESEAMQRYSETIDSLPRRLYAQLTAAKLRHREDEILRSARGHVVCSERERAQLLQSHPSASIAVVENGVDVAYFAEPQAAPRDAGQTLVFVGSMDYFPNQEACISFANHIWPRVRTAFPQLRLVLVGSNPPPSVTALGQLEGITVTGTVPDVRPYYQNAVAAIIPIRTGSGTRLKILEALAAGVPVISSPLGAEGLAVTPGKNILMADPADPGQWIQHLTALANTPSLARQLADEGRALVRERYDWETLGQKLVDTYRGWL